MKKLILFAALFGALPLQMMAQDDDMYYVPSKKHVSTSKVTPQSKSKQTGDYYIGTTRDVDEYNRHGKYWSHVQKIGTDSLGNDIVQLTEGRGVYPDSAYVDTTFLAKYLKDYTINNMDEDDEAYRYSREMNRWDFYGDPFYYYHGYWGRPYGWYGGYYDPYWSYGWAPYGYYNPYWSYGWGGFYDPYWYGPYYGYGCYGYYGYNYFGYCWYDPWYYGSYYYPMYGGVYVRTERTPHAQNFTWANESAYGSRNHTFGRSVYGSTAESRGARGEYTNSFGSRSHSYSSVNSTSVTRTSPNYTNNNVTYSHPVTSFENSSFSRPSSSSYSVGSYSGGHSAGSSGGGHTGGGSFGGHRR